MTEQEPTPDRPSAPEDPGSGPGRTQLVRVVRRPRMLPFLVTGAALGLLAGLLLAVLGPESDRSGSAQELILLGAGGALLGGLLGGIAFLLAERFTR